MSDHVYELGIAVAFRTPAECDAFIAKFREEEPDTWQDYFASRWFRASDRAIAARYNLYMDHSYEEIPVVESVAEYAVEDFHAVAKFVHVDVVCVDQEETIKKSEQLSDDEQAELVDQLDEIMNGAARVELRVNGGPLG